MTCQASRSTVHFPIGSMERSWKGNRCFEPGVLLTEGPIREFFSSDSPLTLERVSWRMMCASCGRGTRLLFRWNEFLAWRRCRRCLMGSEVSLVLGMVLEMRARALEIRRRRTICSRLSMPSFTSRSMPARNRATRS